MTDHYRPQKGGDDYGTILIIAATIWIGIVVTILTITYEKSENDEVQK